MSVSTLSIRCCPLDLSRRPPADSEYVEKVYLGFEYSVPALARAGNRLIVDYPFHYLDSLPRCLDLVSPDRVLYGGVFSPIEVLEQREATRGDRKIGLARSSKTPGARSGKAPPKRLSEICRTELQDRPVRPWQSINPKRNSVLSRLANGF